MKNKKIITMLAVVLTLLTFRFLLIFIRSDFLSSIYPSWNITLYSEFWYLNYTTLTYGLATLTIIAIYKLWIFLLLRLV